MMCPSTCASSVLTCVSPQRQRITPNTSPTRASVPSTIIGTRFGFAAAAARAGTAAIGAGAGDEGEAGEGFGAADGRSRVVLMESLGCRGGYLDLRSVSGHARASGRGRRAQRGGEA